MVVSEILIFICVFLIAKYFWVNRRFYYLASKIPYSSYEYTLKGLYELYKANHSKNVFHIIQSGTYNKTEVAKTWFGPVLFIIANNPDDLKIIFNDKACHDKPYYVKFADSKKGSLFGAIEYWRSHRKVLNPFFGIQGVKSVVPIFNRKVKVLMNSVDKNVGKGEFNVFHDMTALTLETILNVMEFEVDIQNKDHESRDSFIKNLEFGELVIALRMIKVWQHPEFIFKMSSLYKDYMIGRANSAMSFVTDIVANVRKNMTNQSQEEIDKPKSFMRALLSPKNNFTYDEIYDEVKSVVLAAQDTTAITTSATLLMLAIHKDVQAKVMAELYEVFGRITEAPYIELEKTSELTYMEMVINEVLRLYPVIPIVARHVDEEIVLSDRYRIPKNADILVPIYALHRNPKYWGDKVNEFIPERFEKENFEKIHPYAFIPYTKGPRMCIGYRYAMCLMKIQLANFLLRYEVDTSMKFDEIEVGFQVTITLYKGCMISIKHRKCDVAD